jgi:hypothetical protein
VCRNRRRPYARAPNSSPPPGPALPSPAPRGGTRWRQSPCRPRPHPSRHHAAPYPTTDVRRVLTSSPYVASSKAGAPVRVAAIGAAGAAAASGNNSSSVRVHTVASAGAPVRDTCDAHTHQAARRGRASTPGPAHRPPGPGPGPGAAHRVGNKGRTRRKAGGADAPPRSRQAFSGSSLG